MAVRRASLAFPIVGAAHSSHASLSHLHHPLQDALGSEGAALFTALSETPGSYTSDGRPLVARAAAACEKLRYAEDKHGAATQVDMTRRARHYRRYQLR